jgi:hypothetical protein
MNGTKLLMTVEHGQDVYRCELRHLDDHVVECQWFLNGALLQTCRFTSARFAMQWADEQRRAILAGTATLCPHCPACYSVKTEVLTTAHRNDPLCHCRACQHFWRLSPLEDADTAR